MVLYMLVLLFLEVNLCCDHKMVRGHSYLEGDHGCRNAENLCPKCRAFCRSVHITINFINQNILWETRNAFVSLSVTLSGSTMFFQS